MMSRMVRCVNALVGARRDGSGVRGAPCPRGADQHPPVGAYGYSAATAKDGSGAKASLWRRFAGTPRLSSAASVAVMNPSGPQ